MSTRWHQMEADEVLGLLKTSRAGLDASEAARRLAQHGPNVLARERRRGPWALLVRQLTDVMILILAAAAAIAWADRKSVV